MVAQPRVLIVMLLSMIVLALLPGCTTSVVVKGRVPTPLVHKIPARVAVHYPEAFKNYQYKEVIKGAGTWDINLGAQNLAFFRNLIQAMFTQVEEVAEPSLTADEMQRLDGILVPEIVKFGFLVPEISGLKFYSVSIEYQIVMYNSLGEKTGEWNIVGYGKSEGGVFAADDALSKATALAIRDGGARLAIGLADQPGVQVWLNNRDE